MAKLATGFIHLIFLIADTIEKENNYEHLQINLVLLSSIKVSCSVFSLRFLCSIKIKKYF